MLRAEKNALHVYGHHSIPLFLGKLVGGAVCTRNAGVINQRIDSAKVLVHRSEDCFYFGFLPNVKMPKFRPTTRLLDLMYSVASLAIKHIRDRQKRTFVRQKMAGGSPNA